MALTPDQVDDFVNLTLPEFKKNTWTDLSMQYQEYVWSKMMDAKRVVERGGSQIDFKVQVRNIGNAQSSGLFGQVNTKVDDVTTYGRVPWKKVVTSWAYDIDEDLFQTDPETIVRELVMREHVALNDLSELCEVYLWTEPASTTADGLYGIPYWLQTSATEGFNGGEPDSGSAAGISTTTYPRWKNYTFPYAAVTMDDFVKRIKKAQWYTNFRAPNPHPETAWGKSDYTMYSTRRVTETLERLAETRNDNLGTDLARYVGAVTIGGVPVEAVPYLEANDTTDPIYGINWKVMRPYVKKGANMRRMGPIPGGSNQPTVRKVFIDTWMNLICVNRRLCYVGYNTTV